MIRHGDEHDAVALNVSGFDKGLLVSLPDAVNDGRLSRIGRGSMIEFPAQIDRFALFCLACFAPALSRKSVTARITPCPAE